MSNSLNSLQPWGSFLLRVILGVAMVSHGYGKVIPASGLHGNAFAAMNHHSHLVVSLGLPYWLGYVSALTEFVGGILILLGLFTRFSAFMIACNMLVAILFVTRHHGYSGSEYALSLFAIAVMLLFTGSGVLALDRRIGFA